MAHAYNAFIPTACESLNKAVWAPQQDSIDVSDSPWHLQSHVAMTRRALSDIRELSKKFKVAAAVSTHSGLTFTMLSLPLAGGAGGWP